MNGSQKRLLVRVLAVLGIGYGVLGLLVPTLLIAFYEIEGSVAVEGAVRFFGAAEIGFGLLAWALSDLPESWSALFGATAIGQGALMLAGYLAISTGAAGTTMWQGVVLSAILAALCIWARRDVAV